MIHNRLPATKATLPVMEIPTITGAPHSAPPPLFKCPLTPLFFLLRL